MYWYSKCSHTFVCSESLLEVLGSIWYEMSCLQVSPTVIFFAVIPYSSTASLIVWVKRPYSYEDRPWEYKACKSFMWLFLDITRSFTLKVQAILIILCPLYLMVRTVGFSVGLLPDLGMGLVLKIRVQVKAWIVFCDHINCKEMGPLVVSNRHIIFAVCVDYF